MNEYTQFYGSVELRMVEIGGLREETSGKVTGRVVRWDQGVIDVPPEVSKAEERRLIPILPLCSAWLKKRGPIVDGDYTNLYNKLWRRIKLEETDVVWKRNALRHSFGSYRVAKVKSLGQVALEMGNSERVIRTSYLEAVGEGESVKYWALRPGGK